MKKVPCEAMTHAGRFHADDVFSAALLKIVNPEINIVRSNFIPEGYEGLVFDLRGGEFDHHSDKITARSNGVLYASFGLLWKEYGPMLVGEKAANVFDETFVQPLDIQDNMGGNNQLARAITQANPKWDSNDDADISFNKAVEMAKFILQNEIDGMHSAERGRKLVQDALEKMKNQTVILPVGIPWKSVLVPSEALFVVYPSARGGYNAQAIPISLGEQRCKCLFPEMWSDKSSEEIKNVSGIDGITFCHPARYLLNADTEIAAVEACKYTVLNK